MMNDFYNKELLKGKAALKKVISNKTDVYNAFICPKIGPISLIYGKPGNPDKDFKGGYGISHIIAKRNHEVYNSKIKKRSELGLTVVNKLIEVIIKGNITRTVETKPLVQFTKGNYEAILCLEFHGKSVTWILTGYKIKKGL